MVPLGKKPAVVAGKHLPPTLRARDLDLRWVRRQAGASEWRCPGDCKPASVWIKADRRTRVLYRQRDAVEREFGNLKHDWALDPLRVRRIERVRPHADLAIWPGSPALLLRRKPYPSRRSRLPLLLAVSGTAQPPRTPPVPLALR